MTPIKFIYTLFLGLLVALFIGWGVAAFYPAPQGPEYPLQKEPAVFVSDGRSIPTVTETTEQKAERLAYEKASRKFSKETFPRYNKTVSMITMVGAILTMIISLTLLSKIDLLSDGLLLGGVLTELYSIIRGLMAEDTKWGFVTVTIGLIIALLLGYIKFIKRAK
jgi:hypothetical protein